MIYEGQTDGMHSVFILLYVHRSPSDLLRKISDNTFFLQQELLPTIEFGKSNWAYLVDGKYGPRLVYHNKIFKTVTTPTWTTPIDISEIRMTTWGTPSQRRGWWRGKQVGKVSIQFYMYPLWAYNNHQTDRHPLRLG